MNKYHLLHYFLLLIILTIVQLVLLVLRINTNVTWYWSWIFFPFWLLSFFLILYFINVVRVSSLLINVQNSHSYHQQQHEYFSPLSPKTRYYIIYYGIHLISFITFVLFIDLQLDLDFTTWPVVFIPFWVMIGNELFWILHRHEDLWQRHQQQYQINGAIDNSYQQQQHQNGSWVMLGMFKRVLMYASLIIFGVFVSMKLQGSLGFSWSNVFVPAWVFIGLWGFMILLDYLFKYVIGFWYTRPYQKTWTHIILETCLYLGLSTFTILLKEDIVHEELTGHPFDPLIVFSPLIGAFILMFWICWMIIYFSPGTSYGSSSNSITGINIPRQLPFETTIYSNLSASRYDMRGVLFQ